VHDARPERLGVVPWTSRNQDYDRLVRKLKTESYQRLLDKLRDFAAIFHRFAVWTEVIAFMRVGSSRDLRKNDILKAILWCHDDDWDHRWRTTLLTLFWPALVSLKHQKCRYDDDEDILWQHILWAFHETVCQIDLTRRDHGLVQKLVNDTAHRLYAEYNQEWNAKKLQEEYVKKKRTAVTKGFNDMGIAEVDLEMEQETLIRWLQSFERRGLISETDLHLIIGTRIYSESLAEAAEREGLGFEAAKKRRQRAEAKIRVRVKKT
jgi:hypothetical protein